MRKDMKSFRGWRSGSAGTHGVRTLVSPNEGQSIGIRARSVGQDRQILTCYREPNATLPRAYLK